MYSRDADRFFGFGRAEEREAHRCSTIERIIDTTVVIQCQVPTIQTVQKMLQVRQ